MVQPPRDDLVPLASYETPFEAHAARGRLEAAGITAQVADANTAEMLFIVGTALGGAKLLVWKSQYEQAAAILFPQELEEETEGHRERRRWKCAKCREWNEPAFDLCWSCGADYCGTVAEDAMLPPEAATTGPAGPVSFAEDADVAASTPRDAREESTNPYASSQFRAVQRGQEMESFDESDPEVEAIIMRAWRASIFGLVICPLVLQFYSMWLLLIAAGSLDKLNPASRRWFYLTLAVDVLTLFFYGLVLTMFSSIAG